MDNLDQYLAFAKTLAAKAGETMRQYMYDMGEIMHKDAVSSVVTIADEEINQYVISQVTQSFPDHGVLGEEASHNAGSDWLWVCDPIDGTVGYIAHVPTSMFSLALVHNGQPVLAVCLNPWTQQLYWTVKGRGAWRNDTQIHVSARTTHDRLVLSETGFYLPKGYGRRRADRMIVHFPSIVAKACLVAEGGFDGVIYSGPHAHDCAATALLVAEAGGRVTDVDGNPQLYNGHINGAILTNGQVDVHQELVDVIARARAAGAPGITP